MDPLLCTAMHSWRSKETLRKVEAARILEVSRWTLERIIRRGELETLTVGRRPRVRTASLRRYLGEEVEAPRPALDPFVTRTTRELLRAPR